MNEDFSEIIAAVKKFAVDNLSLSTLSDEELEEQIKTITDNMIGNRYVSIKTGWISLSRCSALSEVLVSLTQL